MKKTKKHPVLSLKEMWEKYDISIVKDLLHDLVSFNFPSSLTWIVGKENVIKYFKLVLEGSCIQNFLFGVEMEYEVVENSTNDYSLMISQREGDSVEKCLLSFELLEDKIFIIEMEKVS